MPSNKPSVSKNMTENKYKNNRDTAISIGKILRDWYGFRGSPMKLNQIQRKRQFVYEG